MKSLIIWQFRCGAIIQCLAEPVFINRLTMLLIPINIDKAQGTDSGVTVASAIVSMMFSFPVSLKNCSAI